MSDVSEDIGVNVWDICVTVSDIRSGVTVGAGRCGTLLKCLGHLCYCGVIGVKWDRCAGS